MRTFTDAKAMAKALRDALDQKNMTISHGESLEIVARQFGFDEWNVLAAKIGAIDAKSRDAKPSPRSGEQIRFHKAIAINRIFSLDKAREFYCGWLGFTVDWEHRFGANFPLYLQVSRGDLSFHLSEHHGDATPGSTTFVEMSGIAAFHGEISAKDYRHNKPGLEKLDWGLQVEVVDPFSNRIRFCERTPET